MTRRPVDRSCLQLDRVFASKTVADRVSVDAAEVVHDGASDRAAVYFTIDLT